jgi:hypothetical protein
MLGRQTTWPATHHDRFKLGPQTDQLAPHAEQLAVADIL